MQAINEQSLKLLNEYIERLHSQQEVQPVSLIFYMRSNASNYARNLKTTLQHSTSEGKSLAFNSNIKKTRSICSWLTTICIYNIEVCCIS